MNWSELTLKPGVKTGEKIDVPVFRVCDDLAVERRSRLDELGKAGRETEGVPEGIVGLLKCDSGEILIRNDARFEKADGAGEERLLSLHTSQYHHIVCGGLGEKKERVEKDRKG